MVKRGQVQRMHMNYFTDVMQQVKWDVNQAVLDSGAVPDDWHEIARAAAQGAADDPAGGRMW